MLVDEKLLAAPAVAEMWHGLQELGGYAARRRTAPRRERKVWESRNSVKSTPQARSAKRRTRSRCRPVAATGRPCRRLPRLPRLPPPSPRRRKKPPTKRTSKPALHDLQRVHQSQQPDVRLQRQQAGLHRQHRAGTYRELVEAAETCQVSIIHPGQPRNPNEPGLAELLKRAEAFR